MIKYASYIFSNTFSIFSMYFMIHGVIRAFKHRKIIDLAATYRKKNHGAREQRGHCVTHYRLCANFRPWFWNIKKRHIDDFSHGHWMHRSTTKHRYTHTHIHAHMQCSLQQTFPTEGDKAYKQYGALSSLLKMQNCRSRQQLNHCYVTNRKPGKNSSAAFIS